MPVSEYKPKIVAFCCNWCSYAGADLAGNNRLSYPAEVKIIRVPCSCRVNPMFILRAFQRGADGVIICGCHPGDCHYTSGNYYTRRRMALLFSMLNYLGIEKEADYCTLVTCTPYAVNTHRLLVRGRRIEYEEAAEIAEAAAEPEEHITSTWTQEYIKGILASLFAAAVMTLCMVLFRPFRKRGKHEHD